MRTCARTGAVLAGGVLSLAIAWPAVAAPTGTPTQNGCPSGTTAVSVKEWVKKGYVLIPTWDANADGVVCQKPVNDVQAANTCEIYGCPPGTPIYAWSDNFRDGFT